MRLAADISPRFLALPVLGILIAVTAPAGVATRSGGALTAYLGVTALAPIVGAFPVPWMGLGVSSILGAWLGFGLLIASARGEVSPSFAEP